MLCFSVVAAMPRAAVAVEETMVEAQLVVTKPLKFKVSVPFMHFFCNIQWLQPGDQSLNFNTGNVLRWLPKISSKLSRGSVTRIMQSPERHVVEFHDRVHPVIMESDLETNFSIIKETTFSIYERCLKRLNMGETDFKEIPNLEDFEASFQAANNSTVAHMGLKRFYLG